MKTIAPTSAEREAFTEAMYKLREAEPEYTEFMIWQAGRAAMQTAEPARTKLHQMQNDEGQIGWYFDCDGHYIDVERDEQGKYSIYFFDRASRQDGWLDQADAAPDRAPSIAPAADLSISAPKIDTSPERVDSVKVSIDSAAVVFERAAQRCDQQADGTNGAYRTACLECADSVRELRDQAIAALQPEGK